MTNTTCLNCDKELSDKFCSGCGQKSDTRRITFKNFILQDLLHGTFNIERGIIFTAKQALLRPGIAALEYISGKRKRYYNIFLLILLAIGVMLFTRHFDRFFIEQGAEIIQDTDHLNEASRKIDEIFSQKSKIILLLFVPIAALNSFILFRRKKLNFSEHIILSGMILLGLLLINIFGNILFLLNRNLEISYDLLSIFIATLCVIYVGYGYFNAFNTVYNKWGISFRIVLFFTLICIEIIILILALIGFVTGWKLGTPITLSPFG